MEQMGQIFVFCAAVRAACMLRTEPSTHIATARTELRTLFENPHLKHIRLRSQALISGLPIHIIKSSGVPTQLIDVKRLGLYKSDMETNVAAAFPADFTSIVKHSRSFHGK
jgi:hypothetical protein